MYNNFDATIDGNLIRRIVLEISYRAHVGHIGSALSIADIIAALYASTLNIPSPENNQRDRFILSKGHAAPALYAALFAKGFISKEELLDFCKDGSLLGTHPDFKVPGVDFCTGSLGQGISYAVGSSIALRYLNFSSRVFVIVSNAECNEGSLWEAALSAAQHKLDNLIVIVDSNEQQALGLSKDILDLTPLAKKWASFGWDTHEVDGHNMQLIIDEINNLDNSDKKPHVLVAKTISGKGVSFMEKQLKWHYWPLTHDEYEQALKEIDSTL